MAEEDNNTGGEGGEGQTPEGPSPEVIAKATEMGWSPRDKFRGDPEKWVEADEFVRKGEEVLPLIRASNRKLNERLSETSAENTVLKSQLQELQESVQVLQEVQQRESVARIDRQIKVLRREIEEARTERDPDKVVELQERLDELDTEKDKIAQEPIERKKATDDEGGGPSAALQQELRDWSEENTWFGQNKAKTAIANSLAREVKADPAFKGVLGKRFLDEVKRRTEEVYATEFPNKSGSTTGKTLNGDGTATGTGRGTRRGKGYLDLPSDARHQVDLDVDRLVGPNKVFKKKEDYHAFYVKEYFGEEA
jgi:uncharacterized protein YqgV (UPF0045/DUF77 family)